MATKSVIEIDILDEKFQNFAKEFDRLKKAVKDMPKDWQSMGAAGAKGATAIAKEIEKAEKKQKDFNKAVRDGGEALKLAARTSANIAMSMASAAVSAAKWIAFGAIGSGFGLGGIAANASDVRRQAMGYGVSTGQLRASLTHLTPLVDPESLLTNVTALQRQVGGSAILGRIAPGTNLNKNPAELLPDLIEGALRVYRGAGRNWDLAKTTLEPAGFDIQTMVRLDAENAKNLQRILEDTRKAGKNLAVTDEDSIAWQRFWVQIKESGQLIEVAFIKNLKVLTPALEQLSKSVATAVDSFLKNENFANWIDTASKKIKEFGEYLGGDKFKTDVDTFLIALQRLGEAAYATAQFLGLIDKSPEQKDTERKNASDIEILQRDINKDIVSPIKSIPSRTHLFNPAFNKKLADVDPELANTRTLQKDTNKDNNKDIVNPIQSIPSRVQMFNPAINKKLAGVDPELAAAIQTAGFTPISGVRDEKWAKENAAFKIGNSYYTKQGRPIAMTDSKHLTGTAVDVDPAQVSKGSFVELQAYLARYNLRALAETDRNHLELIKHGVWQNKTEVEVCTAAGADLYISGAQGNGAILRK